MNLSDPELELVDPTPNVHSLFIHFDQVFFWSKLVRRSAVRWSKRMYSCAGVCSYSGGFCDIALSEPLLKLRPRKDLVETLLHEMIHAYLFITDRDRDRDGHGPKFKEHMYRINKAAGINISIYHDFHDEVELYRTHWWRCNGPCQTRRPHFGIVRRTSNRAPGPTDYWWKDHQRKCGGTFVKFKEPENFGKKKPAPSKPSPGDITKYINTTATDKVSKPVLRDSNNIPVKSNLITKNNNRGTNVVTISNIVKNPQVVKSPVVTSPFSGKGQTISGKSKTKSEDVLETVRNIWANKQSGLPTLPDKDIRKNLVPKGNSIVVTANKNKNKADNPFSNILSPPSKIRKIDDYFKSTANSLLKDLYGQEFEIKETNTNCNNKRFSVVPVDANLIDCPVCNKKIRCEEINRHLDECLNEKAIKSIRNEEDGGVKTVINIKPETNKNSLYNSKIVLDNREEKVTVKNENVNLKLENTKTEIISELNNWNANVHIKNEKTDDTDEPKIKIEPSTSKNNGLIEINEQECPCCGKMVSTPMNDHLDECLAFFDNNTKIPVEGASSTSVSDAIVIDDDEDIFDESLTLNATGTKSPCPCCMKMIELDDMNSHLDVCLS